MGLGTIAEMGAGVVFSMSYIVYGIPNTKYQIPNTIYLPKFLPNTFPNMKPSHTKYQIQNTSPNTTQRGFTMLELIIIVAIVAIIGVGSIGSLRNLGKSAELSFTAKVIAADLRLMQAKAMIGEGGRMWGVRFEKNSILGDRYMHFSTLTNYASGITTATTTLMKGITFSDPASGIKDIIFSKISGATVSTTVVIVYEGKFATTTISAIAGIF